MYDKIVIQAVNNEILIKHLCSLLKRDNISTKIKRYQNNLQNIFSCFDNHDASSLLQLFSSCTHHIGQMSLSSVHIDFAFLHLSIA